MQVRKSSGCVLMEMRGYTGQSTCEHLNLVVNDNEKLLLTKVVTKTSLCLNRLKGKEGTEVIKTRRVP